MGSASAVEASPVERAAAFFQEGFSCSQALLAAFAPELGLEERTALKVSCAFGGGMASSGGTCGAVTGALMVLGLAHGRAVAADQEAKNRTYRLTRELWSRFRARHGSVLCREILGIDIGTPDGSRRAAEAGLFRERCPVVVRDAARIVRQLLDAEAASVRG